MILSQSIGLVLGVEDTVMTWAFNHMPTIAVCLLLIAASVWLTIRIVDYRNRLRVVESDSKDRKKDIKSLKKSVAKIDKKVDRVDQKLDRLITYLTATEKINFKD